MIKVCKNKKRKGFTLIEMIIYVAILGIISVLTISAVLTLLGVFSEVRVSRDVSNAATVSLERIIREVRFADSIDVGASTFDLSPGRLTLNTKDSSGANTTIEFFVSGNMLRVKESGVDSGALIGQNVTTDNLIFRSVPGINSNAIRAELTLTATRGNSQKTRTFYSTAVLRGGY